MRVGSEGLPISLLLNTNGWVSNGMGLPLVLKMMYFVLEMLTAMRLLLNQFAILCNSELTKVMSSLRFLCFARQEVSSANRKVASSVEVNKSFI